MNSSPMIFLFSSGSTTPRSFPRNLSWARTTTRSTPISLKVLSTVSDSSMRMKPWSTWTATSRSPRALLARAAATLESTPPLSAMMALESPTCASISETALSMASTGFQLGWQPQTS